MNRLGFLKYITIGSIVPVISKFSGKEKDIISSENLNGKYTYTKVSNNNITEKDCDGVVYVKKDNDIYFNQSSIIDVKDFGAVGDGAKDDTIAIQKAIDSCIKSKKTLYISRPVLSYICTQKIKIGGQIYIYGDGMSSCGMNFISSDGIEIADGVRNVIIEKISITQAVRHSNKNNEFTGIKILGSNNQRPYTHIYRDVLIDGFNTAFNLNWLWDSLFDNIKIIYGKIGFNILGTSVNNNICNNSISVEGAESKAIYFSDKINPTEGWRITNLLTFGADYGIHSIFTSNVYVTTPIFDFCKKYGVCLESGNGPSTNWQIFGGYIAMSENAIAAIKFKNDIDNNQIRGNKISNVDILAYPGSQVSAGILLEGTFDIKNKSSDNSFTNFKNNVIFKNNKKNENYIQL